MQLTADDHLPLAKCRISADEARTAIYIDFEGQTDASPVLLGELHETGSRITAGKAVLRHYLLDPTFQRLHGAYNVTGEVYRYDTRCESPRQALNEVIRLARSRDRLIVSWSQHEKSKVLELGLDGMLAEEFARRYRDGKATAKRWLRDFHPDVQLAPTRGGGRHSLGNYMQLIGYELDPRFGAGRTGDNLKELRQAIERRGTWDNMTTRQQQRWIEVLNHNTHDCLALRDIVTRAATELDAAGPPRAS